MRFAWSILQDYILKDSFHPSPAAERVLLSILAVPVVFQDCQRGIGQGQKLVECAVTQNVRAHMQQPLNTLEWILMILSLNGGHQEDLLNWTSPNARRDTGNRLFTLMQEFIDKYNGHSQVTGRTL